MCVARSVSGQSQRRNAASEDEVTDEEEQMKAFKCGHCGQKFNSQEELQQHEKECVPARVK
jgi:hypothetical protein